MEYPKQLISSLATRVDERIKTFCDLEIDRYLVSNDLNSIIPNTLWKFIKNETDTSELRSIFTKQSRMHTQKKLRWANALNDAMKRYPIDENANPFHCVQQDYISMNGRSFHKLYSAKTVAEAIDILLKSVKEWKDDDNSFLIDFPMINIKTKNKVLSSFQLDLFINLMTIIMKSFDGNIGAYFTNKPEVLLSVPVFAEKSFSIPIKEGIGSYMASVLDSPSDNYNLTVSFEKNNLTSQDSKFKVFDFKDNQILLTLLANIRPDFYESHTVIMELGAIAKSINRKPSESLYADVQNRLHNMTKVHFEYTKKGSSVPELSFNFIDSVATPNVEGKRLVMVTLGTMLYDAVVKQNMIAVTSQNYNALELNLCKLLYHNLQKERIVLNNTTAMTPEGLLHKKYDYSYFRRIVFFRNKKKADYISSIKEALDEFVSKQIAISSYRFDSTENCFYLFFFPLNKDELADLTPNTDVFPKQLELPMDMLLSNTSSN